MTSTASASAAETAGKAEPKWSLAIWKVGADGDIEREVLWAGKRDEAPDLATLSRVLPSTLQPLQITDLAVQIVQQAPSPQVSSLLTILACAGCRRASPAAASVGGVIDLSAFHQLSQTSKKSTCGRVFKKGDLVWQCRQCGKDIACVQCDPCFRRSNHVGHEVYFHRSSGGAGCCDCGDPEAWLQQGNCCDHSPPTAAQAPRVYQSANQYVHEDDDPDTFAVPEPLKTGFRAVMDGVVGLLTTFTICYVRGFTSSIQSSPFLGLLLTEEAAAAGEDFVLTVHNDDVHSYDDVMRAFRRLPLFSGLSEGNATATGFMDMSTARESTAKIDRDGAHALLVGRVKKVDVLVSSSEPAGALAAFEEYFRILHDEAGLLVSFLPAKIARLDANVAQASRWLLTVGDVSQGLRRLATRAMLLPIDQQSSNVAFQAAVWSPSDADEEARDAAAGGGEGDEDDDADDDGDEEDNVFVSCNAYDMTRDADEAQSQLFPQEIGGLVDLETLELRLSAPIAGPLVAREATDAPRFFAARGPVADYDRELKTRVRFPFLFVEKTPLSLVLVAHPFLSKPLQTAWNDLAIRYQYDVLFKAAFSQAITVLYPTLSVLFGRHVGVSKETVLRNTVQLYTANTVVEAMSSQCLALLGRDQTPQTSLRLIRPLHEPREPLFITNMLMAAFLAMLRAAGLQPRGAAAHYGRLPDQRGFIHHQLLRSRRYGSICRDLEYTAASPSFCLRLLQGSVNAGSVALWLDICEALSFLDA